MCVCVCVRSCNVLVLEVARVLLYISCVKTAVKCTPMRAIPGYVDVRYAWASGSVSPYQFFLRWPRRKLCGGARCVSVWYCTCVSVFGSAQLTLGISGCCDLPCDLPPFAVFRHWMSHSYSLSRAQVFVVCSPAHASTILPLLMCR